MFPKARSSQSGFTYLSLMIVLAIIGLVTATTIKLGSVLQRSKAEQELLMIGVAFSDALQSYAEATPAGQSTMPATLADLLRDPRFPTHKRHLRKIFVDPVTGRTEWGIVYAGDRTGVVAIYSLSNARPVKISNFPQRFAGFSGALKISDWKFSASSMTGSGAPKQEMQTKPSENVAPSLHSAEKTSEITNQVQGESGETRENADVPSEELPPPPVPEKAYLPLRQDSH